MRKFSKEQDCYINVSRYQMLSKIMNEANIIGTLIGFNEETDMYKVRLNINSNTVMECWYTDEEIKTYYHIYKDRQRVKKENHDKYIKQKKVKKL
jgi:hypothetical protein